MHYGLILCIVWELFVYICDAIACCMLIQGFFSLNIAWLNFVWHSSSDMQTNHRLELNQPNSILNIFQQ